MPMVRPAEPDPITSAAQNSQINASSATAAKTTVR